MAYEPYVIGKPDPTTGNGATFAAELKVNLEALHHAATLGIMPGWNFMIIAGSGTTELPEFHLFVRGVHGLELRITWNSDGNPSEVRYRYTASSGAIYDLIGTVTYTYDTNQNVTAYNWS